MKEIKRKSERQKRQRMRLMCCTACLITACPAPPRVHQHSAWLLHVLHTLLDRCFHPHPNVMCVAVVLVHSKRSPLKNI
jgi:hypothetical protein